MTTNQEMVARAIGIARTHGANCGPVRFIAIYALLLYGGDKSVPQIVHEIGADVRGMNRQNVYRIMESMQMAGIARVADNRMLEHGGKPSKVWSVTPGDTLIVSTAYGGYVHSYMRRLACVIGRHGRDEQAQTIASMCRYKYADEVAALAELGIADVRAASVKAKPKPDPKLYQGGGIKDGSEARRMQAQMLRALCGMGAVEVA